MRMKCLVLAWTYGFALLSVQSLAAQACDPSIPPSNLRTSDAPGLGVLLEWDAVPGSVGIELVASDSRGSEISRRIVGSSLNQFLVPASFLEAGQYRWQVQAACQASFPFNPTPPSSTDTFFIPGPQPCPTAVLDNDGQSISTIQIGAQCWMQENLRSTQYRNGDPIPLVVADGAWSAAPEGGRSRVNGDGANTPVYGYLYNAPSVLDARGVCPLGWRVPSDADWDALRAFLEQSSTLIGGFLKTTGTTTGSGLWASPNVAATNSTSFSAVPAGRRQFDGIFVTFSTVGLYWSSTATPSGNQRFRALYFSSALLGEGSLLKREGLSIRCIQE